MTKIAVNQMFVLFDGGLAFVYARRRGPDGRVNYDEMPWPAYWPSYVTGRWLSARGIRWKTR